MTCGAVLPSRAAVLFFDIPDRIVLGFNQTDFFEIDIDQDGASDVIFRSNINAGTGFSILPQESTRVFTSPPNPPDLGAQALDVPTGSEIGFSLLSSTTILTGPEISFGREIGANLLSCAQFTQLVCIGEFDTQEAMAGIEPTDFVGLALDINGNTHFGYVEILSSGFNGGTILSFAYESEPNVPIIAGAVPEPSSLMLLSFGVLAFTRRNR